MDKTYKPTQHEQKIYSLWEKGGYFTPQPFGKAQSSGQAPRLRASTELSRMSSGQAPRPFVIMLPPPNVTGALHIGHALTVTVEDILIRYHRMKGEPTLWLPGVDHAGIATQNVVERELAKEGKTRFDLGREKFLERVWKWVEKYGHVIDDQQKRMGVSVDWKRGRFTMDKPYQESVTFAFNQLKDKGLIYQGEYIINWCPRCQTAISDLENIHEEKEGKLWYLDYGTITIATTRPETIFADVAVAVNPKDSRYKKLVGKRATIPLVEQQVPIIADDAVDPDFGTGALKITPAHDPLDFEIGQRHDLPHPQVIDETGKMSTQPDLVPKKYWGIDAQKAREIVAEDLKTGGFIKKELTHTASVGHCQRCDTVTEPLLSKQWFLKATALAKPAIDSVKKGKIKIIPKRFEKNYFQWMENIHDWCISRQLWWGHPIPGSTDVLDTWLSSSLWPFATLGWPSRAKGARGKPSDYEYFYPTTVLETGYDILFFWVARMIMMGLELTGKIPFETVYLHGLVKDIRGRKMAKTLGNVIDPMEFIEKYGADALRMALVVGTTPGNDSKLSEEKIIGYRNFTNKLWNIARFALSNQLPTTNYQLPTHPDDKWMLEELDKIINSVTTHLNNFRLSPAGEEIYNFIWHKFADVYIEKTKLRIGKSDVESAIFTLYCVLEKSLRLLHPFMPFLTETIWQLARDKVQAKPKGIFLEKALVIAKWPK